MGNNRYTLRHFPSMMILKCAFVTFFQNRGGGRGKKLTEISMPLKKNSEMKVFNKEILQLHENLLRSTK